ncbi:transcriptional regulator [Candidatus Enterococcus ferrettii]|uniref:Transcriptional regulator n=1 Tax=Candidatus Enterococcus ferrettii TaxID=2815324 RepID=A0ABV0ES12_9ENTE|nr:transcriptional regulator [Enterococcus sp. 665A]MBO1340378.1 transcriptional regulator [Enterococcus sp. 665A]
MEKWKKDYLKGILSDYPNLKEYIKEKEGEISLQWPNTDDRLLITISSDRRLRNLERNHRIIQETLATASPEVRIIIKELYMNPYKNYNLSNVADQVYLSARQVTRLRDQFFANLLEKLGI